jgi:outer membrane receptor protein involved in Fe transport
MNKKTAILLAMSAIQALASDNAYTLDTLSVTAYRDEENVFVQPHSIDVKKASEVRLDQAISQRDLLNSISGVRVEQTNDASGHMTSVRMPLNTNPYYLFLQDGIPVQSSGFFNHNGLAFTSYGLANSVEVLKGAGTALYGSEAVAATINIISAAEPSKTPTSTVRVDGGSSGYGDIAIENSATIDLKKSYRVGVKYNHNDGWRVHNKTDRFELNGRYDYVIDNDNVVKILLSGAKTDGEQSGDFSDYANIENGSVEASDKANYLSALTKTDVRRQYDTARLSAEWRNYAYKDVETSLTPYIRYNRNQYVATWENNLPRNDSAQTTVGLLEKTTIDTSYGRVIVGLDTEYTKADQINSQDFDITTGGKAYVTGPLYDYNVDYFAIAPFVHSDYKISHDVTLSGGLRFDYNRYDYKNNLSVGTDPSTVYYRAADTSDDFSHISPKLSLSYQPSDDLNLYARYANGFRIPQSTMLYSLKANYHANTLDPETSNTYEIGLKKRFGKDFIEVSSYYMTVDNTITSYTAAGNAYKYNANGGSTIHEGIELGASTVLSDELEAKFSYTYSTHRYKNDATYKNNNMSAAPRTIANTRLFYTPTTFKNLVLMGEWQYVGAYFMDPENTREYNGYSIGNLKADYKLKENLSIFGKLNNITDKRYATRATYEFGSNNYTPGDPRQFFAGVQYTW